MIETIRISQRAKEQLIYLKRQTGITQWNVLCRWALCLSMADSAPIGDFDDATDSNVEMRWEVFAGEYEKVYLALITYLCRKERLICRGKDIARFVRQHIHRGVSKLSTDGNISLVKYVFK